MRVALIRLEDVVLERDFTDENAGIGWIVALASECVQYVARPLGAAQCSWVVSLRIPVGYDSPWDAQGDKQASVNAKVGSVDSADADAKPVEVVAAPSREDRNEHLFGKALDE